MVPDFSGKLSFDWYSLTSTPVIHAYRGFSHPSFLSSSASVVVIGMTVSTFETTVNSIFLRRRFCNERYAFLRLKRSLGICLFQIKCSMLCARRDMVALLFFLIASI